MSVLSLFKDSIKTQFGECRRYAHTDGFVYILSEDMTRKVFIVRVGSDRTPGKDVTVHILNTDMAWVDLSGEEYEIPPLSSDSFFIAEQVVSAILFGD